MTRSTFRVMLLTQLLAAVVCFAVELHCHFSLGLHYPYDCPLFIDPGDFFPDFTSLISRLFVHFHTAAFFQPGYSHFMYPPAAALLYEPFALLPGRLQLPAFLTCIAVVVFGGAALFVRGLRLRGLTGGQTIGMVGLSLLLSYPLWFEIQRGNVEIFVVALTALGVWAFFRGHGYVAAACFGIAGAMKLYPAIYLGLFLSRHQFRKTGFAILVAVVISVVSLWLMYPDIAVSFHQTIYGLGQFDSSYIKQGYPKVIGFDHSLFSLYKRFERLRTGAGTSSLYYMLSMASAGIVVYFLRIRKLPLANQVLAFCVASILLPPVSFDYTLLHLYIPVCLILVLGVHRRPINAGYWPLIILLGLLLSPLTEFIRNGQTIEGHIRALLLLSVFAVAVIFPIGEATPPTNAKRRRQEIAADQEMPLHSMAH